MHNQIPGSRFAFAKNNYGFSANLENFSMGAYLIRGKPNESIFDVLALSDVLIDKYCCWAGVINR